MPGKNEVDIEVFKTVSDFLSLFLLFFKRPLITVNDPNKKNENKVSAFLLVASFFRKLLQSRREGKWRRQ